jgi:2,3-bisphosphoglycerate-dependent phosphoglycerate mutase
MTPKNPCLPAANLILLRHGESAWNHEQRFTGWADVGLTPAGEAQVLQAAQALRAAGLGFDVAYTSVLQRCTRSQQLLLEALGCAGLPQQFDWRLNERHYGALTGRARAEAVAEFGLEAVQAWRRGYEARPAPADAAAAAHIPLDARYAPLRPDQLPQAESLADTVERVGAVWRERLLPELRAGRRVLVTGHGNGLRALILLIEGLSGQDVVALEVGNSAPLAYHLDADLRPLSRRELPVPPRTVSAIL